MAEVSLSVLCPARCSRVLAKTACDLQVDVVGPAGLEPATYGLKVRSSAN